MKKIKRFVTVGVTIIIIVAFYFDPLWYIGYFFSDMTFQRPGVPDGDIVVLGIDEDALAMFGQFPWDRAVWAEVLHILNADPDARPAVIALDVLFTERSNPESDGALLEAIAAYDNIVLSSLAQTGYDNSIISTHQIITGYLKSVVAPDAPHGFVNNTYTFDGVKRLGHMRLDSPVGKQYSLSMETVAMFLGVHPEELKDMPPYGEVITYLTFTGKPGDFFELSIADLFYDYDPYWLKDRMVFVGSYAIAMQDAWRVPISRSEVMHGVEIHANIAQMILENNFRSVTGDYVDIIILAALVAIFMLFGELLRLKYAAIVFLVMSAGYASGAIFAFESGLLIPLFSPIFALSLAFLYQLIYSYVIENVEKAKIRAAFKKYVDPKIVDKLVNMPKIDSEEVGVRKDIAVLFVDVRGFTPMTEAHAKTPEIIVETLNSYLELTAGVVFDNGGSVDKFIGDATMALFNGFAPLEDYTFKAVRAAWEMVEGAYSVNKRIKERLGIDIGFGVGVHCGSAIVGNLGPAFRKDYTAIGDVVNTAARLESYAKRSQVLISKQVYDDLRGRIIAESIGEIRLKGKSEPMEAFSVTGIVGASKDEIINRR